MKSADDQPPSPSEDNSSHRSFLERLSQIFLREPTTRDELLGILREAEDRDLLNRDALDMIEGVMQVAQMQVRDIMIPRSQMAVISAESMPEEYLDHVIEEGHSRYPYIDGDKDKVLGIMLAKDFLRYFSSRERGESFDLDDILRPAVFVPESKRLDVLLREFRANRNHMAIVVDEYGGVSGLVTIEDVLEQIVGEIEDEHDIEEDEIMISAREGGHYMVKALTPIEEFNAYFESDLALGDAETLGGVIMKTLEHVPARGEHVTISGLVFRVLRADRRRVHLFEVWREPPAGKARAAQARG